MDIFNAAKTQMGQVFRKYRVKTAYVFLYRNWVPTDIITNLRSLTYQNVEKKKKTLNFLLREQKNRILSP